MHKVATKIKRCRVELLKWNRQHQGNAARRIQLIQEEMEFLKDQGGFLDWDRLQVLQGALAEAYIDEELY